jgi:hypothetical protein
VDIPEILKKWVAKDGDSPTSLVHECYIDYAAEEELSFYHPRSIDSRNYLLRHVADVDAQKRPFVRVDSISDEWNQKMREIMLLLRLYPQNYRGRDFLLDEEIAHTPSPDFQGWKVTKWEVFIRVDTDLTKVHQDYITWRKGGTIAESIFSWIPYREQATAKIAAVNERSIHLHLHR